MSNAEPDGAPVAGEAAPAPVRVGVLIPVFPRARKLEEALASCLAQTRRPDRILLLDDGSNADSAALAETHRAEGVQYVVEDFENLAAALNAGVRRLQSMDYIAVLLADDLFTPGRLAACLELLEDPAHKESSSMVVTGLSLLTPEGHPLPEEDPRCRWYAAVWSLQGTEITPAEWLGVANFAGPVSNIFARTAYLQANPFLDYPHCMAYASLITCAAQGRLLVRREDLLRHRPPAREKEAVRKLALEHLAMNIHVMDLLAQKLDRFAETRRNFTAYHRAAWNNLSGFRADIFHQVLVQTSQTATPLAFQSALEALAAADGLRETPNEPLLQLRGEGDGLLDPATLAAENNRMRRELQELREDHRRLSRVADALKTSSWVRFGAWLGSQNARRILELEEDLEKPVS